MSIPVQQIVIRYPHRVGAARTVVLPDPLVEMEREVVADITGGVDRDISGLNVVMRRTITRIVRSVLSEPQGVSTVDRGCIKRRIPRSLYVTSVCIQCRHDRMTHFTVYPICLSER